MIDIKDRISTKKQLKEWLIYERKQYKIKKFNFFSEPKILFKHNKVLRKCEYYNNCNKIIFGIIYKIKLRLLSNKYQIRIPINTCKKGLKIMHIGSILLNPNCSVGENVAFHINTALVAKGTNSDAPKIGNNVVLGIGSIIVGGVEISNNIAIGANSVVTKSFIKEDVAIAGNPAKVISENGRTKWNKY